MCVMANKQINIVNKKAHFSYEIVEKFEAGIVLVGSEVKSIRLGQANIGDAFCFVEKGELVLKNCLINSYEKGSYYNEDERRTRKLLVHKAELKRLIGKSREKGLTLVPIKMYFVGSLVKVEVGLGRGKKLHDKKATLKERDINRDTERQIASYNKR